MGYLPRVPNVTRVKCLTRLHQLMIKPWIVGQKLDTLPRRHKSRLVQQGLTSVDKLSSTL